MIASAICCDCERPDWPFVPVTVPCGSSRTICVVPPRRRRGATALACSVRITNADGVAMTKECVMADGLWTATFPASHFQRYGTVKNGVAVVLAGKDERGNDETWIARVGDLRVSPIDAGSMPGTGAPRDVYHRSEVVGGVQHYKRETLAYSERQGAWGAEYEGDYVYRNGEYVPFVAEGGE